MTQRVMRALAAMAGAWLCLSAAAVRSEDHCVPARAVDEFNGKISEILRSQSADKRFVLPREREAFKDFDRVGVVSIRDKLTRDKLVKSGSGTLINACYVLTSYHVVFPDFDSRSFKYNAKRSVVFSFGVSDDQARPFKQSIEGIPVDLGLFDPQRPVHLLDQLLIRLKQPVALQGHAIEFAAVAAQDFGDAHVWACGFPGNVDLVGGAPQSLYCDQCQIKGYHDLRGYETNCTMPAGTSGGGVFRMDKDAQCEAGFKLRLVGAPNQSPEREVFPKDHPRIRSFVTDFNRTLTAIKNVVDADDCGPLIEPSGRLTSRQTSP